VSYQAVGWVSDAVCGVSPTERAVLYFLADKAREHDGVQQAWPSAGLIADRLGIDRRTAQRALRSLEAKALILRGDQSLARGKARGKRPVVWALSVPENHP
jgi:DNA-binding MarR family transcriptional regulator